MLKFTLTFTSAFHLEVRVSLGGYNLDTFYSIGIEIWYAIYPDLNLQFSARVARGYALGWDSEPTFKFTFVYIDI